MVVATSTKSEPKKRKMLSGLTCLKKEKEKNPTFHIIK